LFGIGESVGGCAAMYCILLGTKHPELKSTHDLHVGNVMPDWSKSPFDRILHCWLMPIQMPAIGA